MIDPLTTDLVAALRHYADRSNPTQLMWTPQTLLTDAADLIEAADILRLAQRAYMQVRNDPTGDKERFGRAVADAAAEYDRLRKGAT